MTPKFESAVLVVLEHEKGLFVPTEDMPDHGGITNWGISLTWLASKGVGLSDIDGDGIADGDLDGDGDVDADDIRKLTSEKAKWFYFNYWWKKHDLDRIQNLDLATKMLDMAVNHGSPRAFAMLQKGANRLGAGLTVDGLLGPKTVATINELDAGKVLLEFRAQAAERYARIALANPKMAWALPGWMRRAVS